TLFASPQTLFASPQTAFTASPSPPLKTPPQIFELARFADSDGDGELLAGAPPISSHRRGKSLGSAGTAAFHMPSGASILRASAGVLRGVSVLGAGSP
ncbi:hypothetical protein FA95DRAFT_1605871, partial [Auriscalpium vulgare]